MSAPTSGSSGSSSASPVPGYYPDPSIPNYIRYWNGSAWVPGTSRPAPAAAEAESSGEDGPGGTGDSGTGRGGVPGPGQGAAPVAGAPYPRTPSVEESGPMFLDEDPAAPRAHVPQQSPAQPPAPQAPFSPGQFPPAPVPPQPGPQQHLPQPQIPQQHVAESDGARPEPPRPAVTWPEPASGTDAPSGADAPFGTGTPSGAGTPSGTGTPPGSDDRDRPAAEDPRVPRSAPGDAPAWPRVLPPSAERPAISWGAQASPQTPAQAPAPGPVQNPAQGPAGTPEQGPPRGGQGQPPQALPRPEPRPALRPDPQPQPQAQPPQPQAHPQPPQPQAQPLPGQAGAQGPSQGWAAQVQGLAREGGGWRPPAPDPFGLDRGHDRPGGLVRRFAARVIDGVLLGALTGAAAVPLGTAAYHHAKDKVDQAKLTGETVKVWLLDGTTGAELGAVVLVFLLAGLLLEVWPTARWGRTAGKKLVGLQVLDIEAQQPPGFGASLRRWLVQTVLNAVLVGVVGVAWCLFDRPWKQCWHDKAARTFVAGA